MDDGFVTQNVLDWYERFALGQPGAIVVEATGIRDIPSGPLLRISHNRYLDGLKELVEIVNTASGGKTALYIQLIDFLAIKRRPDKEKYLQRFLQITDRHRRLIGHDQMADVAVREYLCAADDVRLREILSDREFEDMSQGFRERVTDIQQQHIRDLPDKLPELFADAAHRAEQAGFAGDRITLRARLHDGEFFVQAQYTP